MLGVHFSHNGTLKVQKCFLDTVKSTQPVLRFETVECSRQKEG